MQIIDKGMSQYKELLDLQKKLVGCNYYLVNECRQMVCKRELIAVEHGMPTGRVGARMALSKSPVVVVLLTDFLLVLEKQRETQLGAVRVASIRLIRRVL